MPELRSETVAIHAGRPARVAGEPLNPPLVPVSSFHESGYAREQGSPCLLYTSPSPRDS